MSMLAPLFVSPASVRHLKSIATQKVVALNLNISSSHLSEGIAAALGFKTHAALRALLTNHPTAPAEKPLNSRLIQRLQQLGYGTIPNDLQFIRNLNIPIHRLNVLLLEKAKVYAGWHGVTCLLQQSMPVLNNAYLASHLIRIGGQTPNQERIVDVEQESISSRLTITFQLGPALPLQAVMKSPFELF